MINLTDPLYPLLWLATVPRRVHMPQWLIHYAKYFQLGQFFRTRERTVRQYLAPLPNWWILHLLAKRYLRLQEKAEKAAAHRHSLALMAVKTCSKSVLAPIRRYGKSPCFSEVTFLWLGGPDYLLLVLPSFNGEEF
jgi:hypothetical protein